jgi:hypothetical protein
LEVIDLLRAFNRKERFYLIGKALGNPAFVLDARFRSELGSVAGVAVPADAFAAMDYHLNWLHAVRLLAENCTATLFQHDIDVVKAGNQEDIDLLVAFETGSVCHMLLIEAKGVGRWQPRQLRSKADRLLPIFGVQGSGWSGVVPRFIATSPMKPSRTVAEQLPDWMAPGGTLPWLELELPSSLTRIERCDPSGKKNATGTFWRLVPSRTRARS